MWLVRVELLLLLRRRGLWGFAEVEHWVDDSCLLGYGGLGIVRDGLLLRLRMCSGRQGFHVVEEVWARAVRRIRVGWAVSLGLGRICH